MPRFTRAVRKENSAIGVILELKIELAIDHEAAGLAEELEPLQAHSFSVLVGGVAIGGGSGK
jgi:hypothetical protein